MVDILNRVTIVKSKISGNIDLNSKLKISRTNQQADTQSHQHKSKGQFLFGNIGEIICFTL